MVTATARRLHLDGHSEVVCATISYAERNK